MSCFPALKPGVNFIVNHNESSSDIYVGTLNYGIKLTGHNTILFLKKANGQLELNEIIKEIGISSNQALEIITPLISHNLLTLATSPTIKRSANLDSLSLNISRERILAELNTVAWRNTLSPTQEILSRKDKEIIILGSNRLAFALLELFLSIGYLNTSISSELKGEIPGSLVGATPFRISDIGQKVHTSTTQINREYALNLLALKPVNKSAYSDASSNSNLAEIYPRKILISTCDFPVESYSDLIIDGGAHLQVGNLSAGKVEIGPIVIPGKTPCYNCISMWKSENLKELARLHFANRVQEPLELPAASVAYLSGLIVSLIDNYFALEKSFLIGSSVVVNLLKPLEFIERFWQPNPRCGCLELL